MAARKKKPSVKPSTKRTTQMPGEDDLFSKYLNLVASEPMGGGVYRMDVSAWESISYARAFDYSHLARRIREGEASEAERALVADILEGKIKRPKRRPTAFEPERKTEIFHLVDGLIRAGEKEYLAIETAARKLGLGRTTVRKFYKETHARMEPQRKRDEELRLHINGL